jgi:transposase-like protein
VARYGQAFKNRAVARLLPPESASAQDVAREIGVGADTLERWRSDALRRGKESCPGVLNRISLVGAPAVGHLY